MKVLVLGATGTIGLPTAQAFVRAGHYVYGLVRTPEKANQVAREEIVPIIGDTSDPSSWVSIVEKLDVVVECVKGAESEEVATTLLDAIAGAVTKYRPESAQKLTYIITSGTGLHGLSRDEILSDTTPTPISRTHWRVEFEQRVIRHPILNGIVVRPALVYGRSGSLLSFMFQRAYEGQAKWYGSEPGERFNLIHPDDIARLYVLLAEKGAIAGGKIFDACNDFTESVDDILRRLTEVSGAQKPHAYVKPETPLQTLLSLSIRIRPYLARALVGWEPRKAGLVDHLEIYYSAWKATKGLE